jgi:hypothetical protein
MLYAEVESLPTGIFNKPIYIVETDSKVLLYRFLIVILGVGSVSCRIWFTEFSRSAVGRFVL